MKNLMMDISPQKAARIAGFVILILIIAGSFIFFVLNSTLEGGIPGDPAVKAAKNIKNNELLLSIVIATILIMVLCNLMIALAFNVIFKTVNKEIALLVAIIRLIYAIIFGINMFLLFINPLSFSYIFIIGQFIYALHMISLGYLVFKSGYIHKIMGILLIIGGCLGYLIEVLTYFIFHSYLWIASLGIVVAVIAEISLALWLLLKNNKISEIIENI